MTTLRWAAAAAALLLLVTGIALTPSGDPDVDLPIIDARALAIALGIDGPAEQAAAPPVLAVDVRSPAEFQVSMIPGAVTKEEFEANAERYAGHRIVPYCTVGVRSGAYTRELRGRGIDAVNFKGSIIGWVEEGLPLVTPDGGPTRRVHTWSEAFDVPEAYEQVTF